MTPDPTVLEHDEAALPGDTQQSTLADRAANTAFGGQSSADASASAEDNGSLLLLVGFIGVILAIGFFRSWWFPGILGGLVFMLFMHELGHFLTARASGMKVTEFFIGFGPKIWSTQRGETEYGVKAIPAGAYVRIMGMTNLDEIDPAEEHRTYRAQPYWQRMMTICAGSVMHFIMATIAIIVLFAAYSYPGFNGPPWSVSQVVPGSTASSLGIEAGDRIDSINGQSFDNWDEFGDVVSELDEGPIEIVIDRGGQEQQLNGVLGLRPEDIMLDGFGLNLEREIPGLGAQAMFVWPQDPADDFGIEQGDVVLSAGGVEAPTETSMALMLQDRVGDDIVIEVLRGGEVVSLVGVASAESEVSALLTQFGLEAGDRVLSVGNLAQPSESELRTFLTEMDGEAVRVQVLRGGEEVALEGTVVLRTSTPFRGFFGVGATFAPEVDRGVGESIGLALGDFATIAKTNLVGLADLANPVNWFGSDDEAIERRAAQVRLQNAQQQGGETDIASDCGGPDTNRPLSVIGIGRLISCSESADQVFFLFAVVNIFIGIFNLVPLLPLDGGHALIATYERARELVTRKPHRVDAGKLVPLTWLVILLLVGLGVWTATLDIFSW